MPNARGKSIDTTFLSLNRIPRYQNIHRDYIAHVMRWSYVLKYLRAHKRHQKFHILDVGCGREAPLARTLFSNMMTHTTGSYTGVDYGPVSRPDSMPVSEHNFKTFFHQNADFVNVALERQSYDVIVCFEMLEHVEPMHTFRVIQRIRSLCGHVQVKVFLSTPCYDAKAGAAANHVNEMSYDALRILLPVLGLQPVATFGTFASQKDYKPLMTLAQRDVWADLEEYFLPEMLSCIFAPLFPAQSRNVIWELSPITSSLLTKNDLALLLRSDMHMSSSPFWARDVKKLAKELAR
jgi:SAM-dependent methyltransferase